MDLDDMDLIVKVARAATAAVLLAATGCATALSPHRESYILAQPHGWVEVTIADQNIPAIPPDSSSTAEHRPETCSIEITREREPYLDEAVYPAGDVAPFHVDSGFRFPLPPGRSSLRIDYSGCRMSNGKIGGSTTTIDAMVERDMVTAITFDGANALAAAPREDTAVTLERIYRRVDAGPK